MYKNVFGEIRMLCRVFVNSTCVSFCRLMFGIFFLLNLVLWAEGSSAAVPFTTLVALLAMW